MLPSTGYFNGINCPFYDSGSCDRPYCHFRHVKKDPQIANDGIESGAILQKLVSAAVQKVLQQTEANGLASTTQIPDVDVKVSQSNTKATYNPTPISELNKINNTDAENVEDVNEQKRRHIPVPYTPRKPASLPIKRPAVDTNGSKPFIYVPPTIKYTPGSAENVETDKYTPPGAIESKEKYLPGTEKELQEYTPDTSSPEAANKRNYIPSSDKVANKSKLLEYKPSKVSVIPGKPSATYQPTPRSLAPCFSSDEEEPDTKKRKVSTDLNGLDDLGAEFDILGQILDEEKSNNKEKSTKLKEDSKKSKHSSATNNKVDIDDSKKEKTELSKSHKSHHKSKSDNKEKSESKEKTESKEKSVSKEKTETKGKSDSKEKLNDKKEDRVNDKHRHKDKGREDKKKKKDKEEKSSHKSSSKDEKQEKSHKSSSKDRDKDKKEGKSKHYSSDKKKHSSSSHSPKSKHSSSKNSEKKSDSKSSRKDSKSKDKHKEKSLKSSKKKDESKRKDDSDHEYLEENGMEEEIELSEDDEETIALECKKIFEEYVPEAKSNEQEDNSKVEDSNINEEEYIPTKKRISRTIDKNIKIIPKPSLKPDFKVSAAQAMADRLAKVREFHSSKNQTPTSNEHSAAKSDLFKASTIPPPTSPAISKIRIAHVPYASTLVSAKKVISPAQSAKSLPSTSSTICQTVKKGSQRVAHIPSEKFIDRPGVLEPLGSKIPANIRSTYLNMMIDECLKLYICTTDAYARAQNEELNTSKKCSTVPIYKNSAAMTVSRLRRELQESNGVKKQSENSGTQSNSTGTWSIEGRNKKLNDNAKEFIGARFYENIQKWILTEEQLRENGFPRPHESGEKGRAAIYVQNNKQKPPKGYVRTCCRCKKEYTVNKKGFAAVKDECIYHPNNKYRVRGEAKYQCCSQDASSDGCCIAPSHVYEYVDYDNLKGYVRTLPPEYEKDDYGVYSLDCEMCYTTHGLDLTRVTVINSACKVVYETLIKPIHPIIDYNTRYSGITEEQMSQVKTTLIEVQATLLAMFNSKTILVGHSLESDFKALKLIHDTVIDTSVLFPHKMGPPYKRALRNLSSEHLKKIIQNSVEGHDSAEDAMVCMELIHYKLKEDLKTR